MNWDKVSIRLERSAAQLRASANAAGRGASRREQRIHAAVISTLAEALRSGAQTKETSADELLEEMVMAISAGADLGSIVKRAKVLMDRAHKTKERET